MKAVIVVSAVLILTIVPVLMTLRALSDPCDGYGDCLSSSLGYIRANPEDSLYLGDSFRISLGISFGPNTVSSQTSWTYDSAMFSANTSSSQAEFRVLANTSSTQTLTASVR